jgi:hypothetical protein
LENWGENVIVYKKISYCKNCYRTFQVWIKEVLGQNHSVS